MNINVNTQFSIGDSIYYLNRNSTIKEYKITNVEMHYWALSNNIKIMYSIGKHSSNADYTCDFCSEESLNERGYYKSTEEIIEKLKKQL